MFDENTSVEMQEVAEPVETNEDLGENEVDVAEQPSKENVRDYERDSAFAEMRRARENAERELAQYRAEQEARAEALKRLTGRENGEFEAIADSLGIDVEDVLATVQADQTTARLQARVSQLEAEKQEIQDQRELDAALTELNKLDKNLTEEEIERILGIADNGIPIEDSYFAIKGKELYTKANPPKEIGKLNNKKPMEKDFITKAEYEAMSEEQIRANPDLVLRSSAKW